jgi:uncharacterized protein YwgA
MLNKKLLSKKIGDYIFCSYNFFGQLSTDLRFYLNDMYTIKDVARNHHQLPNRVSFELVDFPTISNTSTFLKRIIKHIEKNNSLNVKVIFKSNKHQIFDLIYLIKHEIYIQYDFEHYTSPLKSLIKPIRDYINLHNNIPFRENNFLTEALIVARAAIEVNPNNLDAWRELSLLTNTTSAEKIQAILKIKELDPLAP